MSRRRILLIEDEPALVRGLSDMLADHGHDVTVATTGEAGMDAALGGGSDLIVLDIMLPGVNGYEICRAVRRHGIDVPILMLTAKAQEADIVLGLELGADDYLTKPFRPAEFLARVRALLRRRPAPAPVCQFGDCEIDLAARRVRRQGSDVVLTAKEYALLAFFAGHPGRALPRDLILDAVWGRDVVVDPHTVDNFVSSLKRKLGWNSASRFALQTVRGVGYRMEIEGS